MPYILPTPEPDRRGEAYGQAIQQGVKGLSDLLLQALLSGQLGQLGQVPQQTVAPTGNIQGLQLPGGQQFSGTPQAAQRLLPDYIRNLQSRVNAGQLPVGGLPTGFGATPTGQSRMRLLPPLTRQVQQTQLQSAQEELADLPQKRAGEKLKQDVLRSGLEREPLERAVLSARADAAKALARSRDAEAKLLENVTGPISIQEAKGLIEQARKLGRSDSEILAELQNDPSLSPEVRQQLLQDF